MNAVVEKSLVVGSLVSVQCGNKSDTVYRGVQDMIILDIKKNPHGGMSYLVWDKNENGRVGIASEMEPIRNRDIEKFGDTDLENVDLYCTNMRRIGTESSDLTGHLTIEGAKHSLGWI